MRTDSSAVAPDLSAWASPEFRRVTEWAVAAAVVMAAVTTLLDFFGRLGIMDATAIPRALAAFTMLIAGTTVVACIAERRSRELSRRRWALVLLGVGLGLIYLGQFVTYLIALNRTGYFEGWIEGIPLLLGAPFTAVGSVVLCWPPRMTAKDALTVIADSVLAGLALAFVWVALVAPSHTRSGSELDSTFAAFDVWAQYGAVLTFVVVAAANRKPGALPIRQLVLLQSGVLVYLTADIVGDSLQHADRESSVTWSLVFYAAAVALLRAFTVRPVLEPESPRAAKLRDLWSHGIPFLPLLLASAVALGVRLFIAPLTVEAVAFFTGTVVVGAIFLLIWRIDMARERRQVIDERLAANLQAAARSNWFSALVGDSQDLVTVVDRDCRIVFQTPSVLPMLGYEPTDLVGTQFADLAPRGNESEIGQWLLRSAHSSDDRGPHELVLRGSDGVEHETETMVTPLEGEGAEGFVLTTRDVTDRRQLRAALAESAQRDPLTGLPNREAFLSRLSQELVVARSGTVAVAMVDITSFRDFNDSRGHAIGDEVLQAVAAALARLPDSARVVARTGADEFGVIVVSDPLEFAIGELERELHETLDVLLTSDGRVARVGFDMGYAVVDDRHTSATDLLEQTDLAMAAARKARTGGVVRFESTMRSALIERLRAEADLREALDADRLVVHYQPIVALTDGKVLSVEALARLRSADGSLMSPDRFIPLAEDLGLIRQIGQMVLRRSLTDVQRLSEVLGRPISVAVNLSADQLDDSLTGVVAEALAVAGVPPSQLTLELTESILASRESEPAALLQSLRDLGCMLALDDFGTGYSSMAYLAELPVDYLKIDRSFVGAMGSSRNSLILVRTLLQMTHSLGLVAIAEGVETMEQADLLRGMQCDRAQGYLFSRPLALEDLLLALRVTSGVLPLSSSQ